MKNGENSLINISLNIEANGGLYSNPAGIYSRLDRFVSLFDHHFCGNLVTTKDDLSPIFSPKTCHLQVVSHGTIAFMN